MEKRVFLTIAVCVGIFIGWQRFYMKPYLDAQQAYQQQVAAQQAAAAPKAQPAAPGSLAPASTATRAAPATKAQVTTVTLGSPGQYTATITTQGGAVVAHDLGSFHGQNTDHVDMLIAGDRDLLISSSSTALAYLTDAVYSIESKSADALTLSYNDGLVSVKRTYQVRPAASALEHTAYIQFKGEVPGHVFLELRTRLDAGKQENERRTLFVNKGAAQDTIDISDLGEVKEDAAEVHWIGYSSRYFVNALTDEATATQPQLRTHPVDGGLAAAGLAYKVSSPQLELTNKLYYGPKDIEVLKAANPRLTTAVDFGWFTFFAYPLLQGLKWFYKYVHNFGLAIILLTILVKLITYPLTYKSMKSMKDMQRIQPQLQKLREKHADNKEALNKEMLQLMRANGYNPLSGCLPMLVQMPIFIALYNVLYNSIELYGQPFFGWISDLSQKDPYFVTPILLAGVMFLQQKLTPQTATDPAQQRMMTMMPVIFGAMMLWLPSGLTLYMLVNSVVSILQQLTINRSISRAAA